MSTDSVMKGWFHPNLVGSSKSESSWNYVVLVSWFHSTLQHVPCLFTISFFFCLPDAGGSKGERLSAKLKALPGTSEPYESSSGKEIGKWASYTLWLPTPSKGGELEKLCYWKSKYNNYTISSELFKGSVDIKECGPTEYLFMLLFVCCEVWSGKNILKIQMWYLLLLQSSS